jgi:hypothetical protein
MNRTLTRIAVIIIAALLTGTTLLAQELSDNSFLFRSDKVQLSTFFVEINPGTSFSSLNGQSASMSVLSAGFILNDKFSISFFSAASPKINLIRIPATGSQEYDDWVEAGVELDKLSSSTELVHVNFKHSGLRFDYLHRTDRVLFWRAGVSAGFIGGLTLSEDKTFLGLFNNEIYNEPVITVAPEIGLGINLLPWWRVHLDAGYRFLGADKRIIDSADADSFTFSLGFSFGNFGK